MHESVHCDELGFPMVTPVSSVFFTSTL